MPIKILALNKFLDRLKVEGASKFTWVIGAGVSASSEIPLSYGISKRIIVFEYIISVLRQRPWAPDNPAPITYRSEKDLNDFFAWFDKEEDTRGHLFAKEILSDASNWLRENEPDFIDIDIDSPECYQKLFEHFFINNTLAHVFLTVLVKRSKGINLAHLGLAGLLRDFPQWGDTVFTTNFDDLLLMSLLSIGHTARIFGDLQSRDLPESMAPDYPQIVHLHGRHTGYRLLNTQKEIESYDRDLQQSFETHTKNTSLLVLGYAGWNDIVMTTLKKWASEPNLLKGSLFWVPFKSAETMKNERPEVWNFLDSFTHTRICVIEDEGRKLEADSFILSLVDAINYQGGGFPKYRKEIIDYASNQHKFILQSLNRFPKFSPEQVKHIVDKGFKALAEGDREKAIAQVQSALNIVDSEDLPLDLRAQTYFGIGLLYTHLDEAESASNYFVKSEQMWSQLKNSFNKGSMKYADAAKHEGHAFRGLGELALKNHQLDEAYSFFKLARNRYSYGKYEEGEAYCQVLIAEVDLKRKNLTQVDALLQQAETFFTGISQFYGLGLVNKCKGEVSCEMGNYGRGIHFYKTAITHLSSVPDKLVLGHCHQGLGRILMKNGKEEEGLGHFATARQCYEESRHQLGVVNADFVPGEFYLNDDNVKKAAEYFVKAHHSSLDQKFEQQHALILYKLLVCNKMETGAVNNALDYIEEAEMLVERVENPNLRESILEILQSYYNAKS